MQPSTHDMASGRIESEMSRVVPIVFDAILFVVVWIWNVNTFGTTWHSESESGHMQMGCAIECGTMEIGMEPQLLVEFDLSTAKPLYRK